MRQAELLPDEPRSVAVFFTATFYDMSLEKFQALYAKAFTKAVAKVTDEELDYVTLQLREFTTTARRALPRAPSDATGTVRADTVYNTEVETTVRTTVRRAEGVRQRVKKGALDARLAAAGVPAISALSSVSARSITPEHEIAVASAVVVASLAVALCLCLAAACFVRGSFWAKPEEYGRSKALDQPAARKILKGKSPDRKITAVIVHQDPVASTAPKQSSDNVSVSGRSVISLEGSELDRAEAARLAELERQEEEAAARRLAVIQERTRVQELVGKAAALLDTGANARGAKDADKKGKVEMVRAAHKMLSKHGLRSSKQARPEPKEAAAAAEDFEIAI